MVDAEARSGSLLNSGTVTTSNPSVYTVTNPALTGATQDLICAANTARRKLTVQNKTGASVWIGGVAVTNAGATTGYELIDGAQYELNNSFACYAYAAAAHAAGLLTVVEET